MWTVELESEKKLLDCSDTRRSFITQKSKNNKKRKNYQIFTFFNKEINKNLPKYQVWLNGASRGNGAKEKKGAQICTSNLYIINSANTGHVWLLLFCSTTLLHPIWKGKKSWKVIRVDDVEMLTAWSPTDVHLGRILSVSFRSLDINSLPYCPNQQPKISQSWTLRIELAMF